MKYTGFISAIESGIFARDANDMMYPQNEQHPKRKEVIEYLGKGVLCVPFMGCVENIFDAGDDEFTGYLAVYTDGEWFWPQYYLAYLEKYPQVFIDEEFANYVSKNKNKIISVPEERINALEKEFLRAAGFDMNKSE